MRKKYEEFFLGLSEVEFLTMKLLHSVFKRFEEDPVSCRITDNLDVLSSWDIRLIKSDESFSYIDFYDNSKRIDFAINVSGTEEVACHEAGHLLLSLFARGEIPDEFLEVNRRMKKKILNKRMFFSNLIGQYREDAYGKLREGIYDVLGFYERHPDAKEKYFELFPDSDEEEMIEDLLEEHYAFVSAFDDDIDNYNKVSNIVDAIFCGNNPFFLEYGNDTIECILSMHTDDYFKDGYYGRYVTSFDEQFADYVVLRTYPEKYATARGVLNKLLGDEWFVMMDKFYDKVTSRIGSNSKVYQYK